MERRAANNLLLYFTVLCIGVLFFIYLTTGPQVDDLRNLVTLVVISLLVLLMLSKLYMEYRGARAEFLEHKQLLSEIIDNTPALIYIKDLTGKYILVNKTFAGFVGQPMEKLVGKTDREIFPAGIASGIWERDQEAIRQKNYFRSQQDVEVNGVEYHFYTVRFPLYRHSEIYGICAISTNVTELISSQKLRHQKQVAETAIASQEKERQEIGKELHDNISQLLATAKMMLDTAVSVPEMHDTCIRKSSEYIMDAVREVRHLSHRMTAPAFEREKLTDAVSKLLKDIEVPGNPRSSFSYDDRVNSMDENVKLALFRIIQEQLNNILKHAAASELAIELVFNTGGVLLRLTDNGRGFDPGQPNEGIGLKNIRNRVEMLNGRMEIRSTPGQGTVLVAEFPLHTAAAGMPEQGISI